MPEASVSDKKYEKKNISQNVYFTLRNRILNLEYKPGRSLSVVSLSNELGVSRSPVRDVLLQLSRENLVEIFPQSGSRVSLISIHRTEEERFVRRHLELAAIRELFYNTENTTLQKMENFIIQQENAIQENDIISFLYWDETFHREIFSSINKLDCWDLIKSFSPNDRRVRLLAEKIISFTPETVIQSHRDLITAFRERKLENAIAIEEHHMGRISSEILALLNSYPELFDSSIHGTQNPKVPSNIRNIVEGNENFLDSLKIISIN
jgi:DNA-binding GntR family transcriptional regulator